MSPPRLQRLARLSLVPGICIALALVAGAYANKDKEANTAGVTAQAADTAKQLSVANPSPAKAIGQALGSRLVGPRANRNGDPQSAVGCPVSSCVGGVCTLTQSLDPVTDGGTSVHCANPAGNSTPNGWARCYNLVTEGVPVGDNLTIDSVTFGIQTATIDGINIDVVIYMDTDDCPPNAPGADAVEICRKSIVVNIADVGTMITVDFPEGPVIPAGTGLIVEIVSVDDGTVAPLFAFLPMSNANGQCGPSYIRAADCGLAGWVDLADIKFPDAHLIQIIEASVGGIPATCGDGIVEGCEECDPPGPDCLDNCQLPPLGACCNFDGMNGCAQMSDGACAATKTGEYLGDNTDCADCVIIPEECNKDAGPCDEPNATPGCNIGLCCALVCETDPFCCLVEWNQNCVDLAAGLPECQEPPPPPMGIIVYDNSTNLVGFLIGLADDEFGDGATLAGTDRLVTTISLMIHANGDSGATADVTVRIFAGGDDAGGADPGALLWQSDTFVGFTILDSANLYNFAVPNILVPDSITWTIEMNNVVQPEGGAVGPRFVAPPTLGSSQDYVWERNADGTWTNFVFGVGADNNSFGAVIRAVSDGVPCPADIDGSGDVGVKDLLFLLGAWGDCPAKGECPADFDDSGDVGVKDLLFLLGAWGACP